MKNKIYHILMSASLALMLTTAYMTHDTHAISADYTIKICTKTMWWVNYLEGRESKCNLIWLRESYIALSTNN